MRGRAFGYGPAAGALALLPVMLWARSLRAGAETAAMTSRATAAPLWPALAGAVEHVEDRVAAVRAEVMAAARGDAEEIEDAIEIVSGHAGTDLAPPALPARVGHAAGSRLRLVLQGAPDAAVRETLCQALAGFPGVRRATVRGGTDSLLIDATIPAEALAERLASAGLVTIEGEQSRAPAAFAAGLMLDWLDGIIRLRSRGRTDLDTVLAMSVIAAGYLRRDPAFVRVPPGELFLRVRTRLSRAKV